MIEDQQKMFCVNQVINDAFHEMINDGYIKSHGRIVGWFVANAVNMLIDEYSNEDNSKRLQDHLSTKYGEDWWEYPASEIPHEKAPAEWREYLQKWSSIKEDVIREVTDEKRKQWIDTIVSFNETDLFKKINAAPNRKQRFNKEFVQMFHGLFNEIKKDIRPLVSQMDFTWDENLVTLLISGC